MAQTKRQAWRDLKRAGQVSRWGPVQIVSRDEAANDDLLTQEDFALARGAGSDADYSLERAVSERAEVLS